MSTLCPISARSASVVCGRVYSVKCVGEEVERPNRYHQRVENPRDQQVLLYHFWEAVCLCEGGNQFPHFLCVHMRYHKSNFCDAPGIVKVMLGQSIIWSGGLDDEWQMLGEYCHNYNKSERPMRFIGVVNQGFEGQHLRMNYP